MSRIAAINDRYKRKELLHTQHKRGLGQFFCCFRYAQGKLMPLPAAGSLVGASGTLPMVTLMLSAAAVALLIDYHSAPANLAVMGGLVLQWSFRISACSP